LGIPTDLQHLGPPSLRTAYIKFKAIIKATKAMHGLRTNKAWADHLEDFDMEYWIPIFTDLVNIFIAKSQFYSTWKATFMPAQSYHQMKAWLEENSDCESDSEVWGDTKNADDYSFADLASWLNRKDVAKGKKSAIAGSSSGKKSATAAKEKKKKAQKESSPESQKSSEEKKLKLKSKSKSKGKKKMSE